MGALRRSTTPIAIAGLAAALVWSVPPTDAAGSVTCKNHYGLLEATIVGTDGDDVIHGTADPDVIVGGAGDDRITGGGGNDTICGGPGDDVIVEGGISVRGGAGDDTVGGAIHQYGGDGADTLVGTDFNDVLLGGDGKDTLVGGAEHDNLVGGRGDDVVDGGTASDFISADPGDDEIDGGAQEVDEGQAGWYFLQCGDWLYWRSPASGFDPEDIDMQAPVAGTSPKRAVTVDLAAGTASSKATGHDTVTSIESATGSTVGDVMRGSEDSNCLWSYGGNDRVSGRAGVDSLGLGKGADRVRGGAGDDVLSLRTGPARVRGGAGSDWVYWSGPTDIDLATDVVRNRAGRGSAVGIENVEQDFYRGGVLRGDSGSNALRGRRVYGRGGDDFLSGKYMDGGSGFDNCSTATSVRCEVSDPESWPNPKIYVPWYP